VDWRRVFRLARMKASWGVGALAGARSILHQSCHHPNKIEHPSLLHYWRRNPGSLAILLAAGPRLSAASAACHRATGAGSASAIHSPTTPAAPQADHLPSSSSSEKFLLNSARKAGTRRARQPRALAGRHSTARAIRRARCGTGPAPPAAAPPAAPFRSSGGGAPGESSRVLILRWLYERGSPSPAPAQQRTCVSFGPRNAAAASAPSRGRRHASRSGRGSGSGGPLTAGASGVTQLVPHVTARAAGRRAALGRAAGARRPAANPAAAAHTCVWQAPAAQ
jgi:hypothetical protein